MKFSITVTGQENFY